MTYQKFLHSDRVPLSLGLDFETQINSVSTLTLRIIQSRSWPNQVSHARFPIVCQSHKPCCGSLPTRLVVGNIATTRLVGIPATASLVGKPATIMLVGSCFTVDLACSHKLCGNTIVVGTSSTTMVVRPPVLILQTTFSRQICSLWKCCYILYVMWL